MALNIGNLRGIATDTRSLLREVADLRNQRDDAKTAALESAALAAIERVREAIGAAGEAGSADSGEVKRVLLQDREAIDDRLVYDTELDAGEYSVLLEQKGDINVKLFALTVGATLTWDRLFTADELDDLRTGVDAAAQDVRERKELAGLVDGIFKAFSISLKIATRIAGLPG